MIDVSHGFCMVVCSPQIKQYLFCVCVFVCVCVSVGHVFGPVYCSLVDEKQPLHHDFENKSAAHNLVKPVLRQNGKDSGTARPTWADAGSRLHTTKQGRI
jgi:hypothetical protein